MGVNGSVISIKIVSLNLIQQLISGKNFVGLRYHRFEQTKFTGSETEILPVNNNLMSLKINGNNANR